MTESQEQQPVVETQQPGADATADFQQQVELLRAKNAELIGERRKDKERFEQMERQLQEINERSNKQRQSKLAESGEHKKLWEEAQKTVAEREAELNQLRQDMAQQTAKAESNQVRSVATNAMAQMGVFAPDQLYQLMSQKLKLNGEDVRAIDGGVEVPLAEFIGNLKNPGSGYEHFFSASRVSGMGTSAGSPSLTAGMDNPYTTRNFTQIIALENENPELARQLRAEAGAK
jgi:rhamnose utilization protein RhaD (predicted bifunctional aldolase and dehydrogenase)